jgi:ribosomal protein S18 acetylase RimI-like enzyme
LIARVSHERLDGKSKLAQNRSPDEVRALVEKLWARGRDGDARAVELVLAANPRTRAPAFLAAPAAFAEFEGARLVCALDPRDEKSIDAAVALLAGCYWNAGVVPERIARAHRGAAAWVGARDRDGALIASARAISDGARHAWIHDVIVAPAWRGRGLGRALMRLLLDHPSVRGAELVRLATLDAQRLYREVGFADESASAGEPRMLLARPSASAAASSRASSTTSPARMRPEKQ